MGSEMCIRDRPEPEPVQQSLVTEEPELDFDKPITAYCPELTALPVEPEPELADVPLSSAEQPQDDTPAETVAKAEDEARSDTEAEVTEPEQEPAPVKPPEPVQPSFEPELVASDPLLDLPAKKQKPVAPQMDLLQESEAHPPEKSPAAPAKDTEPDHVLVLSVIAKESESLDGPVLQRVIKACGMSFGDMEIYHRYENDDGRGPVQFSMANALLPGTFNDKDPGSLTTKAVSFFMSMDTPTRKMEALECMLATAETVAKHLGGEMLDEDRSVMRSQTREHYRQRIRDYEMDKMRRRSEKTI